MPIVKVIKGNLVEMIQEGNIRLVANPTNCMKVIETDFYRDLDSVIPGAGQVDNSFPLPALYRIGEYSVCNLESIAILNFYTHLNEGDTLEYSALKSCLKKLSLEATQSGNYLEIAIPVMNNTDMETVKKILNFHEHLLITLVDHDKGEVRVDEGQA